MILAPQGVEALSIPSHRPQFLFFAKIIFES